MGPIGVDRIPIGGEAMLVINNELRVPLVSIVDGVVFADVGNVFNSVREFSFTDIRKSGGIGLRIRTPWVLLRGDYGMVIDRRDGEPRGRFYFSIGQASDPPEKRRIPRHGHGHSVRIISPSTPIRPTRSPPLH